MSSLSVNTENIDQLAVDVLNKQQKYRQLVDQINSEITTLGNSWQSPAYDQFKALFEQKLPSLNEGDELMKDFKRKLDTASSSFNEAKNKMMNTFN